MRYVLGLATLLALVCGVPALGQENNQPPTGFKALFNGRDFNDWTGGSTSDPRKVKELSPAERADFDAKMKEGLKKHWVVKDGVLVSDGEEPYLATKEDYGDFEMWVDWKILAKGDSGIYLRGVPQVQIWDPTDKAAHKNGSDKGSGGLWNNKKNERFPTEVADKPVGEWNRMYIRMIGPYVTVKLNGKEVVHNVIMENFYDPSIPVFARGPVYLQTHGNESYFRNVFLREIPQEEANKALAEIRGGEEGFKSVFNGKDLKGWIDAVENYEVADGAIRCKAGKGGNLLTDESYDNFVVRLEYRLPPGGNNGLALRMEPKNGEAAFNGMEIQVLDDTDKKYADLHDYQYDGSLYGLAPAKHGCRRPLGEWNYEEVTVNGDHLNVQLNGFEILDADIAEARKKPMDGREHPGAARTSGHFGFAGHNDPVEFRNIRIKRLPATAAK